MTANVERADGLCWVVAERYTALKRGGAANPFPGGGGGEGGRALSVQAPSRAPADLNYFLIYPCRFATGRGP